MRRRTVIAVAAVVVPAALFLVWRTRLVPLGGDANEERASNVKPPAGLDGRARAGDEKPAALAGRPTAGAALGETTSCPYCAWHADGTGVDGCQARYGQAPCGHTSAWIREEAARTTSR
jgi:hypothetical protein